MRLKDFLLAPLAITVGAYLAFGLGLIDLTLDQGGTLALASIPFTLIRLGDYIIENTNE